MLEELVACSPPADQIRVVMQTPQKVIMRVKASQQTATKAQVGRYSRSPESPPEAFWAVVELARSDRLA